MTDPTSSGWRLSQEQLGFLEELLSEAILDKTQAQLRAALESVREELRESLLRELASGRAGSGEADSVDREELPDGPEVRLGAIDEVEVMARVDARLEDLVAARTRDLWDAVDQIRSVAASADAPATGVPADVVVADDLSALEAWVREQLEVRTDPRETPLQPPVPPRSGPPRWRSVLGVMALLAVAFAAGWVGLQSRIDRLIDRRHGELATLSEEARTAADQIQSRAGASDTLFRDIHAAAAEIRRLANADAVRRSIVDDLTADPRFVAATTGPQGPRGPVGVPERVGLAPGRFSFQNASGATVAVVGQDETGRGHAQIYGQSGVPVAYLGTDNGTEGAVRVRDTSGSAEVSIQAGRASSGLTISTTRGQEAFIRTQSGRSSEMGVANGSGDGGVVLRSQGGFGAISVNGMSVHDFAEVFELATRVGVEPGTVMSVAGSDGRLRPSAGAYDRAVVGVVSGAGGLRSGLVMGTREDGTDDLPLALNGQVFVRVNGQGGPIRVGDLLVASSTPGVAMRGTDSARLAGAVIGKAMSSVATFDDEVNLVRMFVMVR